MSPKTTPSAAKLKPAAPIAEDGLRFSAEILITRISMDHSIQPRDRAAEQRVHRAHRYTQFFAVWSSPPPSLKRHDLGALRAGNNGADALGRLAQGVIE